MATVQEYLSNLTSAQKKQYDRVRKIVSEVVPEFEEVISYGIPTFKYKGKYVLYFGVFKDHMSLFPGASLAANERLKANGFKLGKGTIQFTAEKPVPKDIIKEMILGRMSDIEKG